MAETQIKAGQEQFKYYPYNSIFHLTRNSFWSAGQDSYTQPPAQDPDLFTLLTNVEPITQGTLQHRRGYSLFNINSATQPFTRAYAFRSDALTLRRYVWTSFASVFVTDENGTTLLNPLFTPSFTSGSVAPRMVLSRDYGYFSDGVLADYQKWDGTLTTGNLTKWGIDIGNVSALTFGPNNTGSGQSVNSGTAWTTPGNITGACDNIVASVTVVGAGASQQLYGSSYGFGAGLTGQVITGIQVSLTYQAHNGTVSLTLDGTHFAGGLKSLPTTNTLQTVVFGGPTDLWGLSTITPAQVQAAAFGIFVTVGNETNTTRSFSVDCAQITIFAKPQALTVGTGGAGNINLLSGRTYFFAFQNSQTGTVSNLSAPSLSTGPLTNKNVPLSNIAVSLDPQVDTVLILATADGNDQTTLFLLATVPNGTTTYTDNTPDALSAIVSSGAALLTNPIFQQTDSVGILHGIANNNPPPAADFPVKHKGRLYMALKHTLYFSKNLDEITTSTGTITTKWEEAWPLTNALDVSEQAETISALLSDGETLWIGTERSIRRLIGDSPQNFQKPEVQFNETGVLNQEVWRVVFYEGQPVGTMWLTPDNRVFSSDFNTYQDVGTPIQDVLNSINKAATVGPHASFVSNGAFDLYLLYLPVGADLQPSTVCVFNMRTKRWVIWKPFDLCTASLFNISASGVPQWLFATQQTNLYFWDPATILDRNGVGGAFSQPATVRSSWLNMGDETLKKALNQQIIYTDDLGLTLTIEAAITQDQMILGSPPVLLSNAPIAVGPLGGYLYTALAQLPTSHNWYRFTWSSNNTGVLLGAYNVECIPLLRI